MPSAAAQAQQAAAEHSKKMSLDDLEKSTQLQQRVKKDASASAVQSSNTQLMLKLCSQLLTTLQQTLPIMFQ